MGVEGAVILNSTVLQFSLSPPCPFYIHPPPHFLWGLLNTSGSPVGGSLSLTGRERLQPSACRQGATEPRKSPGGWRKGEGWGVSLPAAQLVPRAGTEDHLPGHPTR